MCPKMTSRKAALARGHISLTFEPNPAGIQVLQKPHIQVQVIIIIPKKNL